MRILIFLLAVLLLPMVESSSMDPLPYQDISGFFKSPIIDGYVIILSQPVQLRCGGASVELPAGTVIELPVPVMQGAIILQRGG